jgi:hypothetical protein
MTFRPLALLPVVGLLAAPFGALAQQCTGIPMDSQDVCTEYYTSGPQCGQCKTAVPVATGNVVLHVTPTWRTQWIAACGTDPGTSNHTFKKIRLDNGTAADPGKGVTLEASLYSDLNNNPVAQADQVHLVGILNLEVDSRNGPGVNDPALKDSLKSFLQENYIFTWDHTPSQFTSHNTPDNGQLTNPLCPRVGGVLRDDEIPGLDQYSVEFVRDDPKCVTHNGDKVVFTGQYKTECDIPEGNYRVYMSAKTLAAGATLPAPSVPRDPNDAYKRPYGSPPGGTNDYGGPNFAPWALEEFRNVDNNGNAIGPIPYANCGATCPQWGDGTPNDTLIISGTNEGEMLFVDREAPEVFMMGTVEAETGRKGDPADIMYSPIDDNNANTAHYRVFAGYDKYNFLSDPQYNVIYTDANGYWTPAEQKANSGGVMSDTSANLPHHQWPFQLGTASSGAWARDTGNYNLARIVALEVVRDTNGNVPQNVAMGTSNFTPIFNTLQQGYAPYNIFNGMAANQCALVKAGAQMLASATAGEKTRRNLFYIGGCPTPNTAGTTAQYTGTAGNKNTEVKWFANSNYPDGSGQPGMLNGRLLVNVNNSPLLKNGNSLPDATEQCFKDVKGSVDNLFMMTSTACQKIADDVSALNVSGSGCENACKLGAGGDSPSDCAAKFLYCLTGQSREIRKR